MIIYAKDGRFAAFGATLDGRSISCPAFVVVNDIEPGAYPATCWIDAIDTPIEFMAIIDESLEHDIIYEGTIIEMEDL